jgi:gliding motility-associated-like protein
MIRIKPFTHCLFFLLTGPLFSFGQCENNLVLNGSFSDTLGEAHTAANWLIGEHTPDVNSADDTLHTTPCYYWIGTPVASSDGGTWQNVFGPESVYQMVNLTVGAEYRITFEYAAQGIECPEFNMYFEGPVGVQLYLNDSLHATTPQDETQYTWETFCYVFTATTSSVSIILSATDYQYVGIDGFCLTLNNDEAYELGPDTLICIGESMELAIPGGFNFLWSDGSSGSELLVNEAGTYWVSAISSIGCPIQDTIIILVHDCDEILEQEADSSSVEIPNVFTPNDDGSNDLFTPLVNGMISNVHWIILNRWGNVVHESDSLPIIWDGTDLSGKPVTDGVYFWKMEYTDSKDEQQNLHGNVTVVR